MKRGIGYEKAGRVVKQLPCLPTIAIRKQWLNGCVVNIFVSFVDNVSLR
jgi:hypothetical protein